MRANTNPFWVLILVAILSLPLTACTGTMEAGETADPEEASDDGKAEKEAVPVEVVALDRGPIEATLRFSTNLEAESEVKVFSQSSRQVRQLLVEEGDKVRKGQVLLRLQDDEQRTTLAKVESQLARSRREYERQKRLHAQELISDQAFNDATYDLEQLELALEEAQRELSYTEVRAPISGTITARLVNLGDFVTVNQHLFDLVDFDSIVARVYVPEKELTNLSIGQEARLLAQALGGEAYSGRVLRIAPIVDAKSGTVKVTVAIPRGSELRPGLFVDVELVTATHPEALLVPKRALVYDADQVFVYRMADGSRVERVLVEPVLEDKRFIEATDVLSEGDRVVIAGQAGLKDGARVRLAGEKPAAPGAPAADEAEARAEA